MDMNTALTRDLQVLLAEDDAVSALYLADALTALGCIVQHHADGADALHAARIKRFDLLLLDLHLPRCDGSELLARLRADATSASRETVAIATCAGLETAQHAQLLTQGFCDALPKPLSLTLLTATLNTYAAGVQLDEARGHIATGSAATLAALRGLLVLELAQFSAQFDALLARDPQGLCERLHQLRASCGFCGALQLQDAAAVLHDALHQGRACAATQARLRALLSATRLSLMRAGAIVPAVPMTTRPAPDHPDAR
jgi:CheY-like chemotaxis protein